jgi:Domain of unknown function (DUF222)
VSDVSFPGPGPDGEQPPPGVPVRDDDWDADAEIASYFADLDAGRARIPEEWEIEGPAASISLGDAADVDLAELVAMLGPDGLGGEVFAQDRSADAMRPGPVLAALTEQAAGDLGRLSDNQVLGAMSAARRLAARAAWLELRAVAEFTRRREAQFEAATAAKVPRGCRDGEFPDAELAMELVTSPGAARDQMGLAGDLETRLPRASAGLGAGVIDADRTRIIWRYTRFLSDADAARADEVLAALAPGLRYDQLARKAAALAMKLDPEAMKRGKEQTRADRQRVVAGREESGNAYLSGRELAIEDALASKAHIDALALALRRGGLPGTLQRLRVLAFTDLTQGRDPLSRLGGPRPAGQAAGDDPGADAHDSDDASWDGYLDMPEWQHERRGTGDDDDHEDGASVPPGPPAPFPALINLTVPAGIAFGWSTAPGQAGGWGLTDPDDTRRLVQAAAQHPRTRWCVTLLGPDGTAIAHGCARGQHHWIPEAGGKRNRDGPEARQAAAVTKMLRRLNVTFTPIVRGSCDHRNAEDRYTPSRKLRHLVCARTASCPAPGCGAQAYHNDLDHTIPHPNGPTDECNLAPPCRRHHRVKQAPGWMLTQPEPGVMRWTTPSGRSYTTRPTVYEM